MNKKKKKPVFEEFNSTIPLEIVGDTDKRSIPKICPWCNKIIKIEEWDIERDRKTGASHGICQECFEEHKEHFSCGEMAEKKLERTLRIDSESKKEVKNIPIVCTWCNKVFKISHWEIAKNQKAGVSHGMCPECRQKHDKELAEKLTNANKGKSIK